MATVFGLLGGLALFIFGMNMMSESLQKVAGDKMKKVLGVLTRNAVCGMLAGALVTAVLQSSSATTVLVIGFVSAGLMSLKQGVRIPVSTLCINANSVVRIICVSVRRTSITQGLSPSGKAQDFDSCIRWFESN